MFYEVHLPRCLGTERTNHVCQCVSLISALGTTANMIILNMSMIGQNLVCSEDYEVEMQFAIATQYTMNLTIFIEIFNNGKEIIADMKK